jgi:lipid II:glycine glycyltransferase (peptidoglycan interpeptide bridge formation enzyme)
MICEIQSKHIESLRPTNVLPQTPFWGRVKENQGFDPIGFELKVSNELLKPVTDKPKPISDDLLVLLIKINSEQSFAYVPYGPKLEPEFENQGLFLEELSEILRYHLPCGCIFIRYDLMWENQWSHENDFFDQSGNWNGPPECKIQEFRMNYKTSNWNLKKSPVDLLPKNTFFLDLTKKEEDLIYNMRYNTRYNVRRALKRGIHVEEYGLDKINEWYKLYRETALRHNMPLQNENYFYDVLKNQDKSNKGVHIRMLMAEKDGKYLASMFLALSNKRGNYLYGASTLDKKSLMASYVLQWEAIKTAKKEGCSEYDMFGSAPNLDPHHPLYGVHIYKKGFGGKLYHRMGCWDYPLDEQAYEMVKMKEINN